jgi:lysophospholipase L1-like esterase
MRLLTTEHFSLDKVLATEARRYNFLNPSTYTWFTTPPSGAITAGDKQTIGGVTVPAGRCLVVNEIRVNVTGKCVVYVMLSYNYHPRMDDTGTGYGPFVDAGTLMELTGLQSDPAGGCVVFSFPRPLVLTEYSNIAAYYVRDTTTAVGAQINVHGVELTNDLNFAARRKIAVVADSLGWQSVGPYVSGRVLWPFRLLDALRSEGRSVRLINKSFGAASAPEMASLTRVGYLDFDFDMLVISQGMNDASSAFVGEAEYKAALRLTIDYARGRNPGCSILVCGPSSTDEPTRVNNIANYRTYASAVQAEYGTANRVYYVDLSTAYPNTSTTDFLEAAGSRVHANKSGHQKLHDVIWPVVQGTHFYQNA